MMRWRTCDFADPMEAWRCAAQKEQAEHRRRIYPSTAELEISCRALHTTCDKNWAAGSESLKTAFLRELTALGIYGTDQCVTSSAWKLVIPESNDHVDSFCFARV